MAECVVNGARHCAAAHHQLAFEFKPSFELGPQRLGELLPLSLSLFVVYALELGLDRINPRIAPDRLLAELARASARQFIELAACMSDACRAEAVGMDAELAPVQSRSTL